MNNSQFRRLVLDTPSTSQRSNGAPSGTADARTSATPSALGSRMRSNIPMTPRTVAGGGSVDFARQLAERDASLNPTTAKKFRSSAAPKGTKLGSGYQDRTQLRTSAEEDEKASRIKALEDMVKLGQMKMGTFEALRDEIIGRDVKNVHLVKGLDYKLLERVRRGEDVLSGVEAPPKAAADAPAASSADVDEELEKLEERAIQPEARQPTVKKGEMAPPPRALAGQKRTRNDILKELKASRQAAAEKAERERQPALGPKFHRFGEKKATSRIEKDERGRDVLIMVDEDGNVKRKVKKVKKDANSDTRGLLMPDKDAIPLGQDIAVPEQQVAPEKPENEDIFEGITGDYDPLGGQVDDGDTSDDSQGETKANLQPRPSSSTEENKTKETVALPKQPDGPKNYFNESAPPADSVSTQPTHANPMQDPTILAALKKASTLDPLSSSNEPSSAEEAQKIARRKQMLEAHDRDAEDMDMGFGSSRFEDEADGADGDRKVKLSVWGKEGGDGHGKGEDHGKRKRGPKKRKGDKDSAVDVLKVMERRKGVGK